MPKSDEEIRKSIKDYEESLPDSERNPKAQEVIEGLISHAAQPLPSKQGKRQHPGTYIVINAYVAQQNDIHQEQLYRH